jgi:hypothetical protein
MLGMVWNILPTRIEVLSPLSPEECVARLTAVIDTDWEWSAAVRS